MPRKDLAARKEYERLYYHNIGRRHYLENKPKWQEQCRKWDAAHRELRRERAAIRRKNDPDKSREINRKCYQNRGWRWHLRKLYGISEREYDALMLKQNGACAICKQPCKTRERLCVDHDHATGKLRGLLCDICNKGLGNFCDDPMRLQTAITYLGGVPFR